VYVMGRGGSGNSITVMTTTDMVSFNSLGTTLFTTSGFCGCYSANYSNWILSGTNTDTLAYFRTISAVTGVVGPAIRTGANIRRVVCL
jgi:hypothetical protein